MSQENFLTSIEQIESEKSVGENQISEIRHLELETIMDDYHMPIIRWFFGILFALSGGLCTFVFFYAEEGLRKAEGFLPLFIGSFLIYLIGWGGEKGTHKKELGAQNSGWNLYPVILFGLYSRGSRTSWSRKSSVWNCGTRHFHRSLRSNVRKY